MYITDCRLKSCITGQKSVSDIIRRSFGKTEVLALNGKDFSTPALKRSPEPHPVRAETLLQYLSIYSFASNLHPETLNREATTVSILQGWILRRCIES